MPAPMVRGRKDGGCVKGKEGDRERQEGERRGGENEVEREEKATGNPQQEVRC